MRSSSNRAARDVGERYLAMILRMTAQAVPEGTVRSRAWFHAGQAGTPTGELLRNFGHFKTFPLQVMLLHLGEINREFQAGNYARGHRPVDVAVRGIGHRRCVHQ